jgi:hypothetical protein
MQKTEGFFCFQELPSDEEDNSEEAQQIEKEVEKAKWKLGTTVLCVVHHLEKVPKNTKGTKNKKTFPFFNPC